MCYIKKKLKKKWQIKIENALQNRVNNKVRFVRQSLCYGKDTYMDMTVKPKYQLLVSENNNKTLIGKMEMIAFPFKFVVHIHYPEEMEKVCAESFSFSFEFNVWIWHTWTPYKSKYARRRAYLKQQILLAKYPWDNKCHFV